jgi:hypothetical protein
MALGSYEWSRIPDVDFEEQYICISDYASCLPIVRWNKWYRDWQNGITTGWTALIQCVLCGHCACRNEFGAFRICSSFLVTCLITPWSRVLLEKLTGWQLVKKFPAFYGTQRFITAFTSASQLSLSWAISIPVHTPTSHFMKISLNIILPSTPEFLQWSLSLRFPQQNPVHASPLFYHPDTSGWGVQIIKLILV